MCNLRFVFTALFGLGVFLFVICSYAPWMLGMAWEPKEVCDWVKTDLSIPNCERFWVKTQDGHELGLYRIFQNKNNYHYRKDDSPSKGAVLLIHGVADSCMTFLMSKTDSLAATLYNAKYDVFLFDHRGREPFRHEKFPGWSAEYWNYTFDEKARFDLPAILRFIRSKDNSLLENEDAKISIIAHSQGGLVSLMALTSFLSEEEAMNSVSKIALMASPVGGFSISFPLPNFLLLFFAESWLIHNPYVNVPMILQWTRILLSKVCGIFPHICESGLCLVAGCSPNQEDFGDLSTIFSFYPRATSFRNLHHYDQALYHGSIMKYNNRNVVYNFSSLRIPLLLAYGSQDRFVKFSEVDSKHMRAVASSSILIKTDFGHGDFIWGSLAKKVLYPKLLEFI